MPRIVGHASLCGSVHVYVVADQDGWVMVEGLELTEQQALETYGASGQRFAFEADAITAFDTRVEAG